MNTNTIPTPLTNRGVLTPPQRVKKLDKINKKGDCDLIIDWFEFTIKFQALSPTQIYNEVVHFVNAFEYDIDSCEHLEHGVNGYTETYIFHEKMKVLINRNNYAMGMHVLLSGYACRELEEYYSWEYLINILNEYERKGYTYQVTRIDIARDYFNYKFNICNKIKMANKNNLISSKYRKVSEIRSNVIGEYNNEKGYSITFGSMSSNQYTQVYDKYQERLQASYKISDDVKTWYRIETRYRHENAEVIWQEIINNPDTFCQFESEILMNYIRFIEPTNTRKERSKTSTWWVELIGTTKTRRIGTKAKQSSIQKKITWIDNTVIKTLATYKLICDNTKRSITDIIVRDGYSKLSEKDVQDINNYFKEQGINVELDKDKLMEYAERMKVNTITI